MSPTFSFESDDMFVVMVWAERREEERKTSGKCGDVRGEQEKAREQKKVAEGRARPIYCVRNA